MGLIIDMALSNVFLSLDKHQSINPFLYKGLAVRIGQADQFLDLSICLIYRTQLLPLCSHYPLLLLLGMGRVVWGCPYNFVSQCPKGSCIALCTLNTHLVSSNVH